MAAAVERTCVIGAASWGGLRSPGIPVLLPDIVPKDGGAGDRSGRAGRRRPHVEDRSGPFHDGGGRQIGTAGNSKAI